MRDANRSDGGRRDATSLRQVAVLVLAVWLGCCVCYLAVHLADLVVSDSDHLALLRTTASVTVLGAGLGAMALARWRPGWVPAYVVAATAVGVSGLAMAALQGTRYAFFGLASDSAFRTEAVTRFADSPALADYAYQDLAGYYPPAWAWLQGRAAALLDMPGWAVVKPATLVVAALVPLVAFFFWRRVVTDGEAAAVVLLTTLAVADLQKPDEWLVLAALLPWWLEVVRGVRAEGIQPRRAWVDGVIVGGLLLTHSVYFLPLGLATLLGWLVDAVRRRPPPLGLRRMLVIGVVGMIVSAPYWGSLVIGRLTSATSDNLQMRCSRKGVEVPPLPVDPEWWLPLAVAGVLWILLRLPRDPRASSLALVLVSGYALTLGGQWLQRYDVALLPHKAEPVVLTVLVVAGVAAGCTVVARALTAPPRRLPDALRRLLLPVAVPVTVTVLALSGVVAFLSLWAEDLQGQVPQQTRYPNGLFPEGHDRARTAHTWGSRVVDPPSAKVLQAWRDLSGRGPEDDSETVLLTTRVDLLATTPVHPFIIWKSIYSHPNGAFRERAALVRKLARCAGPSCAADLLTNNPYDRVDGIIASREGSELHLPLALDNFPSGWRAVDVVLPLRLFEGPPFRRTDVGTVTVVAVD